MPDDDSAPGVAGVGQAIIAVLSLQDAIRAVASEVTRLTGSGGLGDGNANSLIAKLQAAIQQIDLKRLDTALNQLRAFINEIDALVHAGRMSADEGSRLIAAVGRIVLLLDAATDAPPVCAGPPAALVVPLFSAVALSGGVCADPDGQPLRYAWTLDQSPAGFRNQIGGSDTADATLFVNVPTTDTTPYVIRLTVTDPGNNVGSWTFAIFTTGASRF